jgi:hypothetical protein
MVPAVVTVDFSRYVCPFHGLKEGIRGTLLAEVSVDRKIGLGEDSAARLTSVMRCQN